MRATRLQSTDVALSQCGIAMQHQVSGDALAALAPGLTPETWQQYRNSCGRRTCSRIRSAINSRAGPPLPVLARYCRCPAGSKAAASHERPADYATADRVTGGRNQTRRLR